MHLQSDKINFRFHTHAPNISLPKPKINAKSQQSNVLIMLTIGYFWKDLPIWLKAKPQLFFGHNHNYS